MGVRLLWQGAVFAAFLAAAAGCAHRSPVVVSNPVTGGADSTGTREEDLIDDGSLDGVGAADPADASNDAAVREPRRRGPRGGVLELEAVTGFRSDVRVRWQGLSGLSAGARLCGGVVSGYVRFEGPGIVRAVHAGRLTVRGAERIVLGRGMGAYALDGSGPVRGGFAARPSFSRWYGYPGVAAALEWRDWRIDAAALGRSADENALSPATVWTSVSRRLHRGMVGVIAGMPARIGPALQEEPEGGVSGAESPRAASLFASAPIGRVAVSGEVARTSRRFFFAVRIASRETGRGARASALFFDAPHGSPLGDSGLERVGRTDRGARLDITSKVGPVGCEFWMAAGRTRSDSRQTTYRRIALTLSKKRPAPLWWQTSVLYRCGTEEDYPSSPVEVLVSGKGTRDLRVRAAVGVGNGRSASTSVRADVLPESGGTGCVVVLVLSTEVEAGPVDAHFQVAAHSLPSRRPATVWRPGAGPFEWLAPLYGKGSDVALRAGFRVSSAARVYFFYGSSWSGAMRSYAGFEYRH